MRDKRLVEIIDGRAPKRLPLALVRAIERRLASIVLAEVVEDLRLPASNRLEVLRGDRVGQHAIRVNDQWRLCFVWKDDGAHQLELVDYH